MTTIHIVPETIIAIAVLILTFLETIKSHIQEIPKIYKKAVQVETKATRTTGHNGIIQGLLKCMEKQC